MRKSSWCTLALGSCLLITGSAWAADEKAEKKKDVLKPIATEAVKLGRPVDFDRDILPILEDNCIACHNEAVAESRLNLEEVELMLKGGKKGPAIVPKHPEKSLLFLVAARGKNPAMPPLPNDVEATALTPKELWLVKQWILEGAKGGAGGTSETIEFRSLPPKLNPIYSVALSPWGRLVASGRANQIRIYDVETGDELSRLLDPNLSSIAHEGKPMYEGGAAHRDFVNSLAFSPDGTMLASGGYRVVKLWQRSQNVRTVEAKTTEAVTAMAVRADGVLAAVATADNKIALVNLSTGKTEKTLTGHSGSITALEFWPKMTDQNRIDKAATATSGAAKVAVAKAAGAAAAVQSNPKDAKLVAAKAAADKASETARATAATAAAAKVAFDKQVVGQSKLVSASHDKTIRIWNAVDGSLVRKIRTPAAVNDIALTGDAAKIISAHSDNLLRIWDAKAKPKQGGPISALKPGQTVPPDAHLLELKGHGKSVSSVAVVLPGSAQVVSGSEDGTVRVWNIADGKQVRSLKHGSAVSAVAVNPNGLSAVSVGSDNVARLWQLKDGKQIAEMKGSVATARRVVRLTETETVAKQQFAHVDSAFKAAEKNTKEREAASKKAGEARAAADKALVTAKTMEKAELDKVTAAKAELEKKKDDKALQKKVADAQKAATAKTAAVKKAASTIETTKKNVERTGKALASAKQRQEKAKAVRTVAEEKQKKRTAELTQGKKDAQAALKLPRSVAFSPDGHKVVVSGDDNLVHLFNAVNGRALDDFVGHKGAVTAVVFGNGHTLISGSADKSLFVWNTNPAWKLVGQLGPNSEKPLDVYASPFIRRILCLDFSHDGKLLATGGGEPSRSGELMVWDVASRTLVKDIKDAHSDTVLGVEFSRDAKYLLSGAADKFVKIFDVGSGKHVRSFEGHTHHILDVSWKADGNTVASAGADNVIKVWNVETGEQRRTIGGYSKQVTAIQFIGVGELIVSCGGDKSVQLHKSSNGQKLRTFGGGTDFMYASAASRDESVVVAGGEDGVLRIWNGKDGKSRATFSP